MRAHMAEFGVIAATGMTSIAKTARGRQSLDNASAAFGAPCADTFGPPFSAAIRERLAYTPPRHAHRSMVCWMLEPPLPLLMTA